jgi:hypothetical protein
VSDMELRSDAAVTPGEESAAESEAPPAATPAVVRRTASRGQRYAVVAAGAVLVAASTVVGLWFAPFVLGVFLGVMGNVRIFRARTALWCAAVAAALGWAVPLVVRATAGEAVVATARVAGAMAGLPAVGWLFIAVTLLIAAAQAMTGAWLGRSLAGSFRRRRSKRSVVAVVG